MSDDLASLTPASFEGRSGERFALSSAGGESVEVELAEVRALGGDSDARDPFAVIFVAPLEPVLPQRIYTLQHAELGTFDLFLVPVGPDREGRGMQYEAIFS